MLCSSVILLCWLAIFYFIITFIFSLFFNSEKRRNLIIKHFEMISNCRICLCSKPRRDITELRIPEDQNKYSYVEIMLFCLNIKIEEDSKVGMRLCIKCYRKIIEFHKFKTLALKSDAYVHSVAANMHENEVYVTDKIKNEVLSEGSDNEIQDEIVFDFKEECVKEEQSDDELLSVIKKIKYEETEDTKENGELAPTTKKKKKGRPKSTGLRIKKKYPTQPQMCAECGKVVKDLRGHMLVHVSAAARKEAGFKCDMCEKVFMSKPARNKHFKRRHLSDKKECPICGKKMYNVSWHIKTQHNRDSLPFECAPCGRKFPTKSTLEDHITIHTKDRPFECAECGKKFRTKILLGSHYRQVHLQEKAHLCQFCSKSFFKKYHLQNHLRSHTKERPHKCPECGKCFSTTSVLKNHMTIHSDDKNYHCTLCDMSFARSNYLRAHMISHVKLKRYPCQYCGVKFHRSDHRKRHEFTAHLKHTVDSSKTTELGAI